MFGPTMKVCFDGKTVVLRIIKNEELPVVAQGFSDWEVTQYMERFSAPTLQKEEEWYQKTSNDEESLIWGIEFEDRLVGVTGIHHFVGVRNIATTGIAIWDKNSWGKGVASRAHIARTYFASEVLNLGTISSHVWHPNIASRKALERVGYTVTGTDCFKRYYDGIWLDLLLLMWINPRKFKEFCCGRDEDWSKYEKGLENAKLALKKAKEVVSFS